MMAMNQVVLCYDTDTHGHWAGHAAISIFIASASVLHTSPWPVQS